MLVVASVGIDDDDDDAVERARSGRTRSRTVAASSDGTLETLELTADNIELVLDEVRPYLIADGGDVELVEIDGLSVKLKLKGACGSCPSSTVTMMGIEKSPAEKISRHHGGDSGRGRARGIGADRGKRRDDFRRNQTVPRGHGRGELELIDIEEPIVKVKLTVPCQGDDGAAVAVTQNCERRYRQSPRCS